MTRAAGFLAVLVLGGWAAAAADPKPVEAFRGQCAALAQAADKADTITVAGKDGWLFLGKELRHVSVGKFWGPEAAKVSKADKPEQADPLPAIVDFQAQMNKAGIELIVIPVPPKAIIYPDMVWDKVPVGKDGPPRLDTAHQEFYDLLRKQGVNVLDLTPDFLAHRKDADGAIFCQRDTHWSGLACVRAAQRVAAEIKERPWLKKVPKLKLDTERRLVEINGDLGKALPGANVLEKLSLRFVGTQENGRLTPVEPNHASPVILLGDSHNLVFHAGGDMHAQGAGFADQLAAELGIAVDLIAVRGSGATPARINLLRRARARADYLAGKKLVIWCFSAREFTESSGWAKVPVVK